MDKRTKWAGVCPVALLLALWAVQFAGAQGNKKGGQTAFEARAEAGDSGIVPAPLAPLVTGDTGLSDPEDHCEGANSVPDNNRGFFTAFRNCLDDITLPGKNLVLGDADDIVLDRGSMSAFQDRSTGYVTGITFFFIDLNDNQYTTGFLSTVPSPVSTTAPFTIHVHAADVEVRPQGGRNKPVVGHVSIGDIVYTPK